MKRYLLSLNDFSDEEGRWPSVELYQWIRDRVICLFREYGGDLLSVEVKKTNAEGITATINLSCIEKAPPCVLHTESLPFPKMQMDNIKIPFAVYVHRL